MGFGDFCARSAGQDVSCRPNGNCSVPAGISREQPVCVDFDTAWKVCSKLVRFLHLAGRNDVEYGLPTETEIEAATLPTLGTLGGTGQIEWVDSKDQGSGLDCESSYRAYGFLAEPSERMVHCPDDIGSVGFRCVARPVHAPQYPELPPSSSGSPRVDDSGGDQVPPSEEAIDGQQNAHSIELIDEATGRAVPGTVDGSPDEQGEAPLDPVGPPEGGSTDGVNPTLLTPVVPEPEPGGFGRRMDEIGP